MQSEEDRIVMHVLYAKHGWSISEIAREFGVNWRTARRHALDVTAIYGPRPCTRELSDAQLAHVTRRLAVCPVIRVTTLHRELVDLGYNGSYDSLRRRVNALRPPAEREPEIRFETAPGVQLQIDWADCGRWLLGSDLVELYALVAILGYSRMIAVRFALDKTRTTTLSLLVECLNDLGGAPAEVLSDRDPAFVIGCTPGGRAVFAPQWIDLAASLGVAPRACRAYRAKTKGKVERGVREVKEDLLCWITGQPLPLRPSIDDYDALGRRWTVDVVSTRRHRTTKRIVGEAWTEERMLLRAIPERLRAHATGDTVSTNVIDLSAIRTMGDVVESRALADYEEVSS
jgi:transposase